MEMLIVIAIVAVLISVAVPVLSSQLERSREAVDLANVRSAYAQVSTEALLGKTDVTVITGIHTVSKTAETADDGLAKGTFIFNYKNTHKNLRHNNLRLSIKW